MNNKSNLPTPLPPSPCSSAGPWGTYSAGVALLREIRQQGVLVVGVQVESIDELDYIVFGAVKPYIF